MKIAELENTILDKDKLIGTLQSNNDELSDRVCKLESEKQEQARNCAELQTRLNKANAKCLELEDEHTADIAIRNGVEGCEIEGDTSKYNCDFLCYS